MILTSGKNKRLKISVILKIDDGELFNGALLEETS